MCTVADQGGEGKGSQYCLTQTGTTCIVFVSEDSYAQVLLASGFTENSARDYFLKTEQKNVGGKQKVP